MTVDKNRFSIPTDIFHNFNFFSFISVFDIFPGILRKRCETLYSAHLSFQNVSVNGFNFTSKLWPFVYLIEMNPTHTTVSMCHCLSNFQLHSLLSAIKGQNFYCLIYLNSQNVITLEAFKKYEQDEGKKIVYLNNSSESSSSSYVFCIMNFAFITFECEAPVFKTNFFYISFPPSFQK